MDRRFRSSDWLIVIGGLVVFAASVLPWWTWRDDSGASLDQDAYDYTLTGIVPIVVLLAIVVLTVTIKTDSLQLPDWLVHPYITASACSSPPSPSGRASSGAASTTVEHVAGSRALPRRGRRGHRHHRVHRGDPRAAQPDAARRRSPSGVRDDDDDDDDDDDLDEIETRSMSTATTTRTTSCAASTRRCRPARHPSTGRATLARRLDAPLAARAPVAAPASAAPADPAPAARPKRRPTGPPLP